MAKASASKLNTVARCWQKFDYAYNRKIRRKIQSIAPSRGKALHSCLELHYQGKDFTKVVQELKLDLDKMFDEEKEDWAKLPDDIIKVMRGYNLAYRDVDRGIKTIEVEKSFEVPVGKHTLEGRIDWIFEDANGLWVADHKFVKAIPDSDFTFNDVQTTIYFKIAQLLGYEPLGVVFNFVKSKPPKQPQILKNGGVSRSACDTDIPTYMAAVRACGHDPNDYADMIPKLSKNVFYKRVRVPRPDKLVDNLFKDINAKLGLIDLLEAGKIRPVRNILANRCEWDCEYAPLCFAELAGQNTEYMLANDYEPRRKDDGEQKTDFGD